MKSEKKKEISNKKRNLKRMKSRKKKKKKKMKAKNFQNSKISELNQCQCQTMSVSDNVRI